VVALILRRIGSSNEILSVSCKGLRWRQCNSKTTATFSGVGDYRRRGRQFARPIENRLANSIQTSTEMI